MSPQERGKSQSEFKKTYGADWRREAGRRGGRATVRSHNFEHYSALGKKGSKVVMEKHGRSFYSTIGKIGGQAVKEQYGTLFYSRIGTIGAMKKALLRS